MNKEHLHIEKNRGIYLLLSSFKRNIMWGGIYFINLIM